MTDRRSELQDQLAYHQLELTDLNNAVRTWIWTHPSDELSLSNSAEENEQTLRDAADEMKRLSKAYRKTLKVIKRIKKDIRAVERQIAELDA